MRVSREEEWNNRDESKPFPSSSAPINPSVRHTPYRDIGDRFSPPRHRNGSQVDYSSRTMDENYDAYERQQLAYRARDMLGLGPTSVMVDATSVEDPDGTQLYIENESSSIWPFIARRRQNHQSEDSISSSNYSHATTSDGAVAQLETPPTSSEDITSPPPSFLSNTSEISLGNNMSDLFYGVWPDSTRSSRRAPTANCFPYESKIRSSPLSSKTENIYSRILFSERNIVVATPLELCAYDISTSDSPVWRLKKRKIHKGSFEITCIEVRPAGRYEDKGRFCWIGTSEGHIFEVDIRDGVVTGSKMNAHATRIVHIFRHQTSMLSLDNSGNALIFTSEGLEDLNLTVSQPLARFTSTRHQGFVKLLGRLLWAFTSAEPESNTIRIYDIFKSSNACHCIALSDCTGAVTSGTMLSSQPETVYLGHKGGHISIWSISGMPKCVEIMKVSEDDILTLEGVHERLWAGGSNGVISVYDVVPRPWLVTNSWLAHQNQPIRSLVADPFGVERLGQLRVLSADGNGRLRIWDGLLRWDWVENELLNREDRYCTSRDLTILVVSWNLDAAKPASLTQDPANAYNTDFLHDVLISADTPDIMIFNFQELIGLKKADTAARGILKIDSNRWKEFLVEEVEKIRKNTPYTVLQISTLVGIYSCIFIKEDKKQSVKDLSVCYVKRGLGNVYGNKGGIINRLTIDDTSLCILNCHLAAGQNGTSARAADLQAILGDNKSFRKGSMANKPNVYLGGGDGSMVRDSRIKILSGDLNFRVDGDRASVIDGIDEKNFGLLLPRDQLLKMKRYYPNFALRSFLEGPIDFPPTYKYDRQSQIYDTSKKQRVPSWCDRILWHSRTPGDIIKYNYKRWETNVSDHRPVSAVFKVEVRLAEPSKEALVRKDVERSWYDYQKIAKGNMISYYVGTGLL